MWNVQNGHSRRFDGNSMLHPETSGEFGFFFSFLFLFAGRAPPCLGGRYSVHSFECIPGTPFWALGSPAWRGCI